MEFKKLIRILTQPHRVQNVFALLNISQKKRYLLQQQAELEKLRLASPKRNPKEMIEKLKKKCLKGKS